MALKASSPLPCKLIFNDSPFTAFSEIKVEEPKTVVEQPKEEKKPNPIKDVDDDEENQMTLF